MAQESSGNQPYGYVTVTVINPADESRQMQALFRIDPSEFDCVVPAASLREIGILPETSRNREHVDGSVESCDAGIARIEFMGEFVGATVIFGADDAEPILGRIALSSVGIEIDPATKKLRRRAAVRLKAIA